MTVYMKISQDKYELPEAIADSIIELARMCGVSWRTIDGALYRNKRPKGRPKYIAVKIDEENKKLDGGFCALDGTIEEHCWGNDDEDE